MTLKYGTTIMTVWSLKKNEFYVYNIFKSLPEEYWKKDGRIYHIPQEIKQHGAIVFSGNLKGLPMPEGTTPKDVFVGFRQEDENMMIRRVKEGQCIIACDFFCMLVEEDKLNQYFTDMNFFKQNIIFN